MRVYLDNCCYNRPFDPQTDLRICIETMAKMRIQALMRSGEWEYVWSDILVHEVAQNPFLDRREIILEWMDHASEYVEMTEEVVARGIEIQRYGIKPAERFIAYVNRERMDYTKWQQTLFSGQTIEELAADARTTAARVRGRLRRKR